jgi:hypothetical protein
MTSFAEVPDFVGGILRQRVADWRSVIRLVASDGCYVPSSWHVAHGLGDGVCRPRRSGLRDDDEAERRVQRTFIALRRNSLALLTICERAIWLSQALHRSYDPFRRSSKGKGKSMKILAVSAFAIGLGVAGVTASQAMPLAPLDRSASTDTIRVADGCGPGMHRGPYGHCRPLFSCPPGWHSGPYGFHCFRNRW